MANKQFTGYLKDPTGEYSFEDLYKFTHLSTTGQVIAGSQSIYEIQESGYYSISLEYGIIVVESRSKDASQWFNHGAVTINSETSSTTLPALLNATNPVSDDVLLQMQTLVEDAEAAAASAGSSASEAAQSALESASNAILAGGLNVTSIAELQALTSFDKNAYLSLGGRSGWFEPLLAADYTDEITADTLQGSYIASSDGVHVWVRVTTNSFNFDSISEMVSGRCLSEGLIDSVDVEAETLSYYGGWSALMTTPKGGASYTITTRARVRLVTGRSDWEPDGYFDHYITALGDGTTYVAMLNYENQVSAYQIGCKRWNDWGDYDNKPHLLAYIARLGTKLKNYMPVFELKFDGGIFQFSATTLQRYYGFNIQGVKGMTAIKSTSTTFTAYENNQDWVIKIGGTDDFTDPYAAGELEGSASTYHTTNWVFRGITMSTLKPSTDGGSYDFSTLYDTNYGALVLDWATFGVLGCHYHYIHGTALRLKAVWEIEFDDISVRIVGDPTKSKIVFDEMWDDGTDLYDNMNYSALRFGKVMFEGVLGSYIENNSIRWADTVFREISFETYFSDKAGDGEVTSTYIDSSTTEDWTNMGVIVNNGGMGSVHIGVLNGQKFNRTVATVGSENYLMSKVFTGSGYFISCTVGVVEFDSTTARSFVVAETTSNNVRNSLIIDKVLCMSEGLQSIRATTDFPGGHCRVLNNLVRPTFAGSSALLSARHFGSSGILYAEDMVIPGGTLLNDEDSLSRTGQVLSSHDGSYSTAKMGYFRVPAVPWKSLVLKVRFKTTVDVASNLYFAYNVDGVASGKTISGTGTGEFEYTYLRFNVATPDDGLILVQNNTDNGTVIDSIEYYLDRMTADTSFLPTDNIPTGADIYDTLTDELKVWNGSAWVAVGS